MRKADDSSVFSSQRGSVQFMDNISPSKLGGSYRDQTTNQSQSYQRAESTVNELYKLMADIEATVWDNVKLTQINAKLLEYCWKQTQEIDAERKARQEGEPITKEDL